MPARPCSRPSVTEVRFLTGYNVHHLPPRQARTMSESRPRRTFLDAALAVLVDAGRPLTVEEIVSEALARRLIQPAGKTPVASMSARLYTHVRDADHPRVVRI